MSAVILAFPGCEPQEKRSAQSSGPDTPQSPLHKEMERIADIIVARAAEKQPDAMAQKVLAMRVARAYGDRIPTSDELELDFDLSSVDAHMYRQAMLEARRYESEG
jgi:hypothetical protein